MLSASFPSVVEAVGKRRLFFHRFHSAAVSTVMLGSGFLLIRWCFREHCFLFEKDLVRRAVAQCFARAIIQ